MDSKSFTNPTDQGKAIPSLISMLDRGPVFDALAETVPAILWMMDETGRCVWLSRAWYEFSGQTEAEALGRGWLEVAHPDDRNAAALVFASAFDRQEPFEIEWRSRRRDGVYRWVSDSARPRFSPDGVFEGYVGAVFDIDDRRQSEQQREILAREASHRLKNAFAIVQSIVGQSLRTARSLDEVSETLPARLSALATAQDLLMQADASSADIVEIVTSALLPYRTGRGRFAISGPETSLSGEQAFGLALALHELATNAIKYGALSVPDGHLTIRWNVSADRSFEFEWTETDGPTVAPPRRRGFGTRLVERTTALYFDGTSTLDFDQAGVRFRLTGTLRPE